MVATQFQATSNVVRSYFSNIEEAEKLRDYIDLRKGGSSHATEIFEVNLFDSFEEVYGE